MAERQEVTIIIPAYNEADHLGITLNALDFPWVKEIVVVNDGSQDRTGEIAQQYQVKLIQLYPNQGKGQAIEAGIKEAKGEIILLLDADLGESVREAEKLVTPLLQGETEATVAILPVMGGGFGLVRRLADWGLKRFTGCTMEAPLSGQRGFLRSTLSKLIPLPAGFGLELGLDIKMIRKKVIYQEIYCDFNHRVTGFDLQGFRHRGKQFFSIINTFRKLRIDQEQS